MAYNPLEVAGPEDYPVKVGSMLLTLVDPHKGFEKAYNRWYERDHFYGGCMEARYQIAGSRWVATRELKDLRWPAGAPRSPTRSTPAPSSPSTGCSPATTTTGTSGRPSRSPTFTRRPGLPGALARAHRDVRLHRRRLPRPRRRPADPGAGPQVRGIFLVFIDGKDGRDAAATHADLSKELLPERSRAPSSTSRRRGCRPRPSAAAAAAASRWRSARRAATTTGCASSSSPTATCAPGRRRTRYTDAVDTPASARCCWPRRSSARSSAPTPTSTRSGEPAAPPIA